MKFLSRQGNSLEFELSVREGQALRFVLGRYPSLDPAYHQIARPGTGTPLQDEQQLLVEAMSETQRENRRLLESFLARRLHSADNPAPRAAWRLTLTLADADWLLEVLNDVRMGAWVRLGCPEPGRATLPKSGAQALADFSAMEVAGHLQTVLLEALNP